MTFHKNIYKIIGLAITFGVSAATHATVWNIDQVLNGSDGGFGFSSFHDASGNPMSGSLFGDISTNVSGTYNDVSGVLFGSFSVTPAGSATTTAFTLNGTLFFGTNEYLVDDDGSDANVNQLAIDFATNTSTLIDTTLGFMPGDVCCSGNNNGIPGLDPNSFDVSAGLLTLWGANGTFNIGQTSAGNYYDNQTLGMDLRIKVSQVPEPASLMLMGLGLLGLGLRRFVPNKGQALN